jgi:hypothetical protein
VVATAVIALWCALLMVHKSFTDYGPKVLHPLSICLPSLENVMQWHSRLGTLMRSSSLQVLRYHTRICPMPAVANTSLYSSLC